MSDMTRGGPARAPLTGTPLCACTLLEQLHLYECYDLWRTSPSSSHRHASVCMSPFGTGSAFYEGLWGITWYKSHVMCFLRPNAQKGRRMQI